MAEQFELYPVEAAEPKKADNLRRRWENGFQRWSDKEAQDGTYSFGACGYGCMCNYCEDNTFGRPCVRALNAMCRDSRITIDYKNITYEQAWNGAFDNG